jgi:ABC-type transport system substrate-binding protein
MTMRKLLAATTAVAVLALAIPMMAAAQDDAPMGGTMVVTYNDDVSTLDPAIGYDWQNWSIIKSLFSGLMDYKPGTTELVPDLAESYEISEDGLTYTFHLRDGVTFHNGRALTSADIKYSIERTVNPETQSPGQGFFWMIAGYQEASTGQAEGLSVIETPDDRTVVIHLGQPNATFLHVMAINFSFAVPREAVEEFGPDFGKNPVGTGAFKLTEWALGQHLILDRNEAFYEDGVPKLDRIVFEVGQDPSVALLRLENGEVDVLGDPIPAARFVEIMENPDYDDQIVVGGQLHTGYVTMNVRMAPFSDPRVRQAVNMAINKDRIVRIINGRAVPANQPLPPAMPGYATEYEGYAYDPEAAKALLAEAGFPDGFDSELYAMNTDPNPRIAQAIQQDLEAVGIHVELQTLAQSAVIDAGGQPEGAPMIWSGGMAWIADFPDPSNFYWPILSCSGAVPGGWNWSWYCMERLDYLAAEADAMTDPAQAEARLAKWREVYLGVMEDAPWAPVFNEQRFTFHSERIGGDDSLFVDPVHIPVNYDHVYALDAE